MNHLEELQKYFSYELSQGGNSFPTRCLIFNDYGLSVSAEEGTAEKAIESAIAKAKAGEWA